MRDSQNVEGYDGGGKLPMQLMKVEWPRSAQMELTPQEHLRAALSYIRRRYAKHDEPRPRT